MQGRPNFAWQSTNKNLPLKETLVKARYRYDAVKDSVYFLRYTDDGWEDREGNAVTAPDEWQVFL